MTSVESFKSKLKLHNTRFQGTSVDLCASVNNFPYVLCGEYNIRSKNFPNLISRRIILYLVQLIKYCNVAHFDLRGYLVGSDLEMNKGSVGTPDEVVTTDKSEAGYVTKHGQGWR